MAAMAVCPLGGGSASQIPSAALPLPLRGLFLRGGRRATAPDGLHSPGQAGTGEAELEE